MVCKISFLLLLSAVSSASALTLENFDYHNGKIGTGLVAAATSYAVNEVRSDGWWMGITTSLSYAFCRSCDGQIYAGDRLYLLTDIYQRSTPSDTYDSLLESGTPRLKRCTTILTVEWVTPPSFKLNYMECTNESVSNGYEGDGQQSSNVLDKSLKGKRIMMGGWNAADSNSDAALEAALFAADAFNQRSNALRRFALHYVTSASTQIVAGVNYRLDLVLRSTPCRKTDDDNLKATFECDSEESDETEFQRCSIVVWDQPWRTPRYQASTVDCKTAGIAKKRQGSTFGWFESSVSLFKLGDSQWMLTGSTSKVLRYGGNTAVESTIGGEGQVEVNIPDSDWFALFVLSGPRSSIARKFGTFSAGFNRTYGNSPYEGALRYYRFTQNAARVAVARLAELGTAEYDLSTSQFADVSYSEFCASLPSTTSTGTDGSYPWPLLQFYKTNVAQPWSPMLDTAVYRLVAGANAQSQCSRVSVRVAQCGSKPCRSFGTELCTLPFCTVETVASSSTSSETSFTFLSAAAKAS